MGLAMSGAHLPAKRMHGAAPYHRANGSRKAATIAVGVVVGTGAGLLAKAKIASLLLVAPIGLVTGAIAAAIVWNASRPKRFASGMGAEAAPPSNVLIGPDSTAAVWVVAGHTISAAVLRSDTPGLTDVYVSYDGAQVPKIVLHADYDVAKQGMDGLKARILQAMAVGALGGGVAGHERPQAPPGLHWVDDGLPGDVLESNRCGMGWETTPLSRRFERLYARRPDLRCR